MNDEIKKYSFSFREPQPMLIQCLLNTNILPRMSINDSYKNISFFAYDFYTLNSYLDKLEKVRGVKKLSYEECIQIATSIGEQIYYFEKKQITYAMFDIEKIYVIDDTKFIYLDEDYIKIDRNKTILFSTPFSKKNKNLFTSPEILAITTLPTLIPYNSVYYSLGLLLSYLISLEQIKCTKLYWFILRSMNEDVKKRVLLFL
jgi:hypothetical protein